MEQQKRQGVLHVTIFSFLARGFWVLFTFLVNIYASHHLSLSDFGKGQFIIWAASFAWLIFNLGIPGVLNRFVPEYYRQQQFGRLRKLMGYAFILLGIALLSGASVAYVFSGEQGDDLRQLLLILILQFIQAFHFSLLQSFLKNKALFYIQCIVSLTAFFPAMYLISGWGLQGLLSAYMLFLSLSILLSSHPLFRIYKEISRAVDAGGEDSQLDYRKLIRFTLYMGVSTVLASLLWQRSEYYMLKHWFDYEKLAVYGVALTMIALFLDPLKWLTGGLTAYYATLKAAHDPGINDSFSRFYQYLWWLAVFSAAFIWIHATAFASGLYGEQYAGAGELIQILIPAFIPGICSYVVMSLHVGLNQARFLLLQDICSALILLALLFIPQQAFGVEGVAWAKAIAIFFSAASGMLYTIMKLRFKIPFASMIKSLLIAAPLCFLSREFMNSGLVEILLKGFLLFIVYVGCSFITGTIRMQDLSSFKKIFSKKFLF